MQRWCCFACGSSETLRYDDWAKRLASFVSLLLPKESQVGMPEGGRTFRRATLEFWVI